MMRILITGGAGCLGSNMVEHWHPRGHDLCVLDNFATGHRAAVPKQPRLRVVEGSVADGPLVHRVFREFRPTHVVHAAASYKDPAGWVEDAATNVLGTIHVVQAAAAAGVLRLVNLQTALCYGRPRAVPIPVDHPTAPFTSYGISKTAGEAYVLQSGVPAVSLRLANVCGPRLAIGPIPTFYTRLREGKSCFCSDTVRDFLDMADFLAVMDRTLAVDAPDGVFNVSTGEGRSILEVYRAVEDHLGLDPVAVRIVPPGPDDVPSVVLDPVATERSFDWRARVSFADTIAAQLRWYDTHGVGRIFSHLAAGGRE
jgi:UDP-glucose 4-epimerase